MDQPAQAEHQTQLDRILLPKSWWGFLFGWLVFGFFFFSSLDDLNSLTDGLWVLSQTYFAVSFIISTFMLRPAQT